MSVTAPSGTDHDNFYRSAPCPATFDRLHTSGVKRSRSWERVRRATIAAAFGCVGVTFPDPVPEATAGRALGLNTALQTAMSEYVRRARPSLPAFVELVRGQTTDDYRPNKALVPAVLRHQCRGYIHLDRLLRIVAEGVRVRLREPLPRQSCFPRNHPSASERIKVLRKNIRMEQDLFRCIVNSHTDPSDVPTPSYDHCSSLARELLRCKRADPSHEVQVMAGDVAVVYRNACTHSECVHLFAGYIPEDNAIVIDLSAAFGWTGYAGTYSVLGGAVAFVHGNNVDAAHPSGFYSYHWVDDHVNIVTNTGTHCADADRSLRYAMTAVLGPGTVNEDKFTGWRTRQKVLGLNFDTVRETVAMPPYKIAKAQHLVANAYNATRLSPYALRSLLGSLRHVATCVRPAQAFL
ncbi:uncharacterized protein IUM83_06556 [Phytophthora cinnamomi]|uniref:uncharacterized protein n=1 Tax=Phytophthora cinnamomi TaxID=4785 RepID=UPI00355AC19E|nr:hypothetical protein IUM83_06556 [Phytophthora cinnamomi]